MKQGVVSDLPWDTTKLAISRVKCEEVTKKKKLKKKVKTF